MLRPGRILFLGTALIVLLIFLLSKQDSGGEDNEEAVSVVEAFAWDTPVSDTGVLSELRPDDVRRRAAKAGYPDLFEQYHAGIRTRSGDDGPRYPMNYRLAELYKARMSHKTAGVKLPWQERGPSNVSGRTRALLVDPDDPTHHTWFAGSVSGGIWKTTDAGQNWTDLSPGLPNLAISSFAMPASNPDVIYAGTGEGFGNSDGVAGAGIFKSTDRGQTWAQLASIATDPNFRHVNRVIVDPENADLVLAATNTGIYRSENGGGSWTEVYKSTLLGTRNRFGLIQDLVANPTNFNIQYASENGVGVVKSTDGGQNWAASSEGIVGSILRIELAIAPSNPSWIYAATETSSGESHLFLTTDAGERWTRIVEDTAANEPNWLSDQGWYDNAIAVDPFDENRVFLGGIELYEVTLGGTTTISVVKSLDEENTFLFLDFVSFVSATHFDGRMKTGLTETGATITEEEFVSVEVRFGPGLSQKAHRFIPPDGPGILFSTYPYVDYVDVPFEVWDIENNRQLAVSFRDRLNDGAFNL
ncbi:MAG: hypothetical protein IH820_14340, partial [Bacteroidetes bacterium]|nr:hypothetical protein [Bacteroidota bacterium]